MPWGTANASSVSSYTLSDSKPCKPPVIQYYAGPASLSIQMAPMKCLTIQYLLASGFPSKVSLLKLSGPLIWTF
ncbi:hypothetical protein OUZ56_024855 [Daphnia magna]|uniref:Uncharacterized protein n=1 Tax=Daphnia magna TaxID=35525 RepID=A0ABQ9ZI65_9CRUS|nr:hypothetical protein OUZ56_024855 [Daphnia magna]